MAPFGYDGYALLEACMVVGAGYSCASSTISFEHFYIHPRPRMCADCMASACLFAVLIFLMFGFMATATGHC